LASASSQLYSEVISNKVTFVCILYVRESETNFY
jgi:hypothetical protein